MLANNHIKYKTENIKDQTMENKIVPGLLDWTSGKVKGFYGRELINLRSGSVKFIKIDPFAIYPEHIHPDKTEYAFVVEGNPEFLIGAQLHNGQPGDFFIFPQQVKHSIRNPADGNCMLLVGAIKTSG